jgi:hypothetical protein
MRRSLATSPLISGMIGGQSGLYYRTERALLRRINDHPTHGSALAQQALELQLVQQVAPASGAEFASDAERRYLHLRGRGISAGVRYDGDRLRVNAYLASWLRACFLARRRPASCHVLRVAKSTNSFATPSARSERTPREAEPPGRRIVVAKPFTRRAVILASSLR